ncbi:MAG: phosphatidate cytidylyltransferase [Candidatus Dormiibacterota bacterium]
MSAEVESPPAPGTGPLWVRLASAGVLIAIAGGLLALGTPGVFTLGVLVVGFALWEFRGISVQLGMPAPIWLLFPLGLYFVFSGTALRWVPVEAALGIALLAGLTVFLFLPGRSQGLGRWALGLAGAVYIGVPMNYYLLLYTAPAGLRGLWWVLLTLGSLMLEDAAALLAGRRFGRRPFFPAISPKKTWEGALAGLVVGALVFSLGAVLLLGLPWWHGLALGIIAAVAGVVGDLVESQLKRLAGIKDSSNLIPGHGGILDRVDSLLFAPVAVFIYAMLFHLL